MVEATKRKRGTIHIDVAMTVRRQCSVHSSLIFEHDQRRDEPIASFERDDGLLFHGERFGQCQIRIQTITIRIDGRRVELIVAG